jgi:membrane protein DedA with SNARE-associated domain
VTAHRTSHPTNWLRRIAFLVVAISALLSVLFGLRTYGSFLLLRSAYAAGAPMTSSIRPWMTLGYVAATYRTSDAALVERLGLPAGTDPNTSLKSLAEQARLSPPVYTQRVQRVIAEIAPRAIANGANDSSSWLGAIGDQVLTALLLYGYPVLGLTLLLGSIGLPLPDGVATTIAGSMAAQGRMDWAWAGAITVTASVLGDAVGYGAGRLVSTKVLERHGRWVGYTAARRARVQQLFDQWGSLTVFITRTFMSYLSSVASLLAGMSHFRLSKFLAIALVGRVIWTAAYLGLGYGIGADWQAATGFLTNLSVLLLSLMLLAGSGAVASGRFLNEPVV